MRKTHDLACVAYGGRKRMCYLMEETRQSTQNIRSSETKDVLGPKMYSPPSCEIFPCFPQNDGVFRARYM